MLIMIFFFFLIKWGIFDVQRKAKTFEYILFLKEERVRRFFKKNRYKHTKIDHKVIKTANLKNSSFVRVSQSELKTAS